MMSSSNMARCDSTTDFRLQFHFDAKQFLPLIGFFHLDQHFLYTVPNLVPHVSIPSFPLPSLVVPFDRHNSDTSSQIQLEILGRVLVC
jgi:hypothetical protein